MVIFDSYVKLPEGISSPEASQTLRSKDAMQTKT